MALTDAEAPELDRPPRHSRPSARRPTPGRLAVAGGVIVLVVSAVLRFWARSDLWLDEALTVNIARLPWETIPDALRHDGAPPLFYFLLHGWTSWLGSGDLAARSLSGVLSLAALPLMWMVGRRVGGSAVAWAATLLLASSPFAVRYATEARMYSLVVALTLLGALALGAVHDRPTPARVGLVALVSGLLCLTHYWGLYLVAVVVVLLTVRRQRVAAAAVAGGGLLFVPWLPTFAYQLAHTGTPWGEPTSFAALVNAVSEFAGGRSSAGRALGLLFFSLAGLGLFGRALDGRRIELDLRTRPPGRALALVCFGTLTVAVVAGSVSGTTFAPRYTAVVLVPFLLLAAVGIRAFADPGVRAGVLGTAVALGLVGSAANVGTQRTQAGEVAAGVREGARPGDVVAYCPDQLGPAVSRRLPPRLGLVQLTFPRMGRPDRVDWVDYQEVNEAADPARFAEGILSRAGPQRSVWLVWSPGYRTLDGRCEGLVGELAARRPGRRVSEPDQTVFERAGLVHYPPR